MRKQWPCQPQLAPRFSFDLAPHSVAPGQEFFFDLAPSLGAPQVSQTGGGLEAGGGVAAGWFAGGRAGRDAVERLAFGVAELAGDLAESVDEGGQAVGADGVAAVAIANGAIEVAPVADQSYGLRQGRLADPFGHHWLIGRPAAGPAGDWARTAAR
jgi:hypothetical protein